MKSKPTLDDLLDAWRRESARIDTIAQHHDLVQVAFNAAPRERSLLRRELKASSTLAAAAVVAMAILLPPPACRAASPHTDRSAAVHHVQLMLEKQ